MGEICSIVALGKKLQRWTRHTSSSISYLQNRNPKPKKSRSKTTSFESPLQVCTEEVFSYDEKGFLLPNTSSRRIKLGRGADLIPVVRKSCKSCLSWSPRGAACHASWPLAALCLYPCSQHHAPLPSVRWGCRDAQTCYRLFAWEMDLQTSKFLCKRNMPDVEKWVFFEKTGLWG